MTDALETIDGDMIRVTCRDPHCPAPDMGVCHRDYWNSFWAQDLRNEHAWRHHFILEATSKPPRGPEPASDLPRIEGFAHD